MKEHEKFINNVLSSNDDNVEWDKVKLFHEKQIGFIQHERLIHLLVTLAFALFMIISVYFTLLYPKTEILILDVLILSLLVPYIFHYLGLENGIQRWYDISNEIDKRCKIIDKK